jgi:hypothetical protein
MAIDNFIPEIWAAQLETEFLASQIVIPTVSTKFQGDATRGNTVKITGAVTPTIVDYKDAGRSITAEALDDDGQDLSIDQEKAFSFLVDDIDVVQSAGSLGDYTTAAGQALAEDAESFLLNKMLTESVSLNVTGSSPVTIDSADKARAAILKVRTDLNKKKIPTGNRFAVVNPVFASFLIDGLSDVSIAGGNDELRNGFIGRLYGFDILESPLLGDGEKPTVVGYHSAGVAFVGQMDRLEALRHQTKFSDIVRGLSVYGGKVFRQELTASFVSGGVTANPISPFLS